MAQAHFSIFIDATVTTNHTPWNTSVLWTGKKKEMKMILHMQAKDLLLTFIRLLHAMFLFEFKHACIIWKTNKKRLLMHFIATNMTETVMTHTGAYSIIPAAPVQDQSGGCKVEVQVLWHTAAHDKHRVDNIPTLCFTVSILLYTISH